MIDRIPDSFQESYADLSSLRLHFVEGGTGYPLVFLPAYLDTWQTFRLVLPLLAPHFRCLVLDQRGHGKSHYAGEDWSLDAYAQDVIEFLDQQGIERTTLVGSSMGSFVARKVALRCPDRIDRLVLVGSGMRTDNHEQLQGLRVALEQFSEAIPRELAEAILSPNAKRGKIPDWFFNACVDASSQIPGKTWRGALDGLLADNHSDRLEAIMQPTLLIAGNQDEVFLWEDQAQVAQKLPQADLKLYEAVGHYPHWEEPTQFAADLREFLQKEHSLAKS
ncbi:alpha/beta fold hydrolase [Egbenema bharatensis]|uniref:alpha/beta fold hydrolase n=1 Tax=Egbenema bharatensis TaxID=3463334 RepID=UPI003A89F307